MAQSPMLIVRSLLSVVLQPPNQLPTKSPLSVVRSPQRTKQSSRGYQRGRANAKTSVHPATYGNLCTSVWFCKDTKKEILTLTVCPVLSCFVPFCPVLSRFVPFCPVFGNNKPATAHLWSCSLVVLKQPTTTQKVGSTCRHLRSSTP